MKCDFSRRFLGIFQFGNEITVESSNIKKALSRPTARYLIFTLATLMLILIVTAIYGTFFRHIHSPTTFNFTAITEQVQITTQPGTKANWYFKDVSLSRSCPEDYDEEPNYLPFSQSISLGDNIAILLRRIGHGVLSINLIAGENTNSVGAIVNESGETIETLSDCILIEINNIEERYKKGESVLLYLTGEIQPAPSLGFPESHLNPVLKEGEVSIQEKNFLLFREYYEIGPYKLDTGDSFKLINQIGLSEGFVSLDESPAMKLVYRAEAERGAIQRYRSEAFEVKAGVWTRLYHDEALTYLWLSIALLFSIIRMVIHHYAQ